MRIETIVGEKFPLRNVGNGYFRPKSGEPSSLVVNARTQRFFWNARGLCGGTYVWYRDVLNADPNETFDEPEREDLPIQELPPLDLADAIKWHLSMTEHGRRFLVDRYGIGDAAVNRFLLGYSDEHGGCITIPYMSRSGLDGVKMRLIDSQGLRYVAMPGSRFGLFHHGTVVVEGEFKSIVLWQHGVDAIGISSGAVANLPMNRPLIYVRDNDRAGLTSAVKLLLLSKKVVVLSTPLCKAVDDYLLRGETKWVEKLRRLSVMVSGKTGQKP